MNTKTTSSTLTTISNIAANQQNFDNEEMSRQTELALDVRPVGANGDRDTFNIMNVFLISRRKHAQWLAGLGERFPWLPPNTHINIAPGHMSIVERYLSKVGSLLGGKKLEFLAIDSSLLRIPFANIDFGEKVGNGQARAIESSKDIFNSNPICALCGDMIDPDAFQSQVVCEEHKHHADLGILFADDLTPDLSQALARMTCSNVEADANAESANEAEMDHDDFPCYGGDDDPFQNTVRMYDPQELDKVEKSVAGRDRDTKTRIQNLVKNVKDRGCFRQLATLPENWQSELDALESGFPNFAEYVDNLRCQMALASIGDGIIRLLPVILNGPPGIGKSEILSRLANLLDLPQPLKIDFATAQNSSQLTGSDAHWSNSSEGRLFETLMLGQYANPLILIDEIEKNHNAGRYNPTVALYGLLEKTSAAQFEDLSMRGLKIDASHVLWVASANDADLLDEPIKSRFTILNIPEPTAEQTRKIQSSIWKSMAVSGELGVWFNPDTPLPQGTLDALNKLSPRQTKLMLKLAAGRAVAANRKEIRAEDVRRNFTSRDMVTTRRVGFV